MATIVLVPGAWLGGWCWQRVAPSLRAAGHEVYTPTLTGLGERAHLGTPETNLDTHITDIVNLLRYEDLHDVVLLGHSYGGFVITGVIDRAGDRVGRIVYLATSLPGAGESLLGGPGSPFYDYVKPRIEAGDGWRYELPDFEEGVQYQGPHRLSAADQAWFRSKAAPHPFETMNQPLRLTGDPHALAVPRLYIHCTDDLLPTPEAARGPGWTYREVDSGHWPMFTAPAELAGVLNDFAS